MTPAAPTPGETREPRRWLSQLVVAALAVGLAVGLFLSRHPISGDGWEYFQTLVSFETHATPDFRPGDDRVALANYPPGHPGRELSFTPGEPTGWQQSRTGAIYSIHFWAYPLSAVPAKLALRAAGGNGWVALPVTNAAWLLVGVSAVVLLSRRPPAERWAFALLAASPPVFAYAWYCGSEMYSWSLITCALVATDNRRYGAAGLLVGLSALQNAASLSLAGLPFVLAVANRRWRAAAGCAAGGAIGFWPFVLCYAHFGTPSLLAEYADPKLISLARSGSLLFDLNQGLLPHLPVLLVGFGAAIPLAVVRREWTALACVLFWLPMFLAAQVQVNWNSDARGVMRYWVWMIPPLAWVTATVLRGRWRWGIAAASVAAHGGLMALDPVDGDYVRHRTVASWVLTHAPRWYSPDFEIFAERLHGEDGFDGRTGFDLPVGFAAPDGTVTKLLVDRASRGRLAERFAVDAGYLPTLLADADADAPTYLHPPPGTVRARPPDQ